MQLAPEPGVHSAHRGAHHEPRVIYAEPFREQAVLCFDHVEVTVARKFGVHAVAWLARFAVPNAVRQHDKKFCRIERLIFPEQLTGKLRPNKLRTASGRSVHDEHCVYCFALSIFFRSSECAIMKPQLRQAFTRGKFEIVDRIVALSRHRIIGGWSEIRDKEEQEKRKGSGY